MRSQHRSTIGILLVLLGSLTVAGSSDRGYIVCPHCQHALSPSRRAGDDVPPPVVALQVRVPAQSNRGEEIEYRLFLENRSPSAAHHVVLRNPIPTNAKFVRASPEPNTTDPELQWKLGTLDGGRKLEVVLVLAPTGTGEVRNCARVTLEHGVCVATKLTQPALTVKKTGPAQAHVGDMLTFHVMVTNTGDGPATGVQATDTLPDGLEHASGQRQLVFPAIGPLPPGACRTIAYQVVARASGRYCNRVVATGDGGLRHEVEWCVTVTEPRLTLDKTGPQRVYLNSVVPYRLTVTNPGSGPATNVVVTDRLPAGADFVSASAGSRRVGAEVQWAVGTLPAGASRTVELTLKPKAAGEIANLAHAVADRNLRATAELRTEVLGLAALLLELVDKDDPLEIGSDTFYTIIVRNQGSLPATNIQVTATVPPELAVVRVQGAVDHRKQDQQVLYDPLNLPPQKDTIFRIHVRGVQAGDLRFRVEMTADQLPAGPVLEEESTNVYREFNGADQARRSSARR